MSEPPQLTPLNDEQQLRQVMELLTFWLKLHLITMEGFEDSYSPVDRGVWATRPWRLQ